MKRRMSIMLIALGVLFGVIFIWKGIGALMMKHYFSTHSNPSITVSTTKVSSSLWQQQLEAVGSLRATLGVNVTAQLGGMIEKIYFTPGSVVQAGTPLVQQNAAPDIGQLHALEASAALAKITYDRDTLQYKVQAVSKQQLDTDRENLKNANASVAQQAATVDKLTIRAPFTGRLGINNVNPGQYLDTNTNIVTLQRLDPIYVDFYLPQQALARLKVGQPVDVLTDTFGNKIFKGRITTIEPLVESSTRNVEVEATIPNPDYQLTPGMYVTATVTVDKPKPYLTLPQAAVTFNPYGDIVYVVKESKEKTGDEGSTLTAHQVFVTTGDTRGDQVAILKGLKEGQTVVTSGQLKLKNGSPIAVNNKVLPSDNPSPDLPNEHQNQG